MPYGLYISAEGAQAQADRLDVLANNLANVDTPGFKRDVPVFQARLAEAIEQGQAVAGSGSMNDIGGGVLLTHTEIDFAAGPLKHTGAKLDMALRSDAFFAVQKDGETFLTRAGSFEINGNNQLVTQQGFAVLNDTGSPIAIDPNLGPWQVNAEGAIEQLGSITRLGIVRPDSTDQLQKVGANLFQVQGKASAVGLQDRRVATGFLEGSGVNPTSEMMELIETTRAFEANVTLIQSQDEVLRDMIGRLLRV
jgi:flagellar basal-body rod protein FlgF